MQKARKRLDFEFKDNKIEEEKMKNITCSEEKSLLGKVRKRRL